MNDKEFIETIVTRQFLEFKPLLLAHKRAKVELNKAARKLDTFAKKYQFLNDILQVGANDDFLADKIKLLLKDAGFGKVIHYRDKRQKIKREDIEAQHENEVFIIEIKGVNASTPKKSDLTQVFSYLVENKKRRPDKNIYGLSIISHENKKNAQYRTISFFNEETNRDLINMDIGSISALCLLILFKKLKAGEIEFEAFKNYLKQKGFIKI